VVQEGLLLPSVHCVSSDEGLGPISRLKARTIHHSAHSGDLCPLVRRM
jgi:hypothetical protein